MNCREVCILIGSISGQAEVRCQKPEGHSGKHRWKGSHWHTGDAEQVIVVIWENKKRL